MNLVRQEAGLLEGGEVPSLQAVCCRILQVSDSYFVVTLPVREQVQWAMVIEIVRQKGVLEYSVAPHRSHSFVCHRHIVSA